MHFKINTWINHSFIFNCFLFFLVFFFYYLACVFSHTLSSLASLSSLSRLWAFTLRPKWINEAHTKISTHVFIVWCEKKKKNIKRDKATVQRRRRNIANEMAKRDLDISPLYFQSLPYYLNSVISIDTALKMFHSSKSLSISICLLVRVNIKIMISIIIYEKCVVRGWHNNFYDGS